MTALRLESDPLSQKWIPNCSDESHRLRFVKPRIPTAVIAKTLALYTDILIVAFKNEIGYSDTMIYSHAS